MLRYCAIQGANPGDATFAMLVQIQLVPNNLLGTSGPVTKLTGSKVVLQQLMQSGCTSTFFPEGSTLSSQQPCSSCDPVQAHAVVAQVRVVCIWPPA